MRTDRKIISVQMWRPLLVLIRQEAAAREVSVPELMRMAIREYLELRTVELPVEVKEPAQAVAG